MSDSRTEAIDLAWANHITRDRSITRDESRMWAIHDMMAAGLHYSQAKRLVGGSTMPSNTGLVGAA